MSRPNNIVRIFSVENPNASIVEDPSTYSRKKAKVPWYTDQNDPDNKSPEKLCSMAILLDWFLKPENLNAYLGINEAADDKKAKINSLRNSERHFKAQGIAYRSSKAIRSRLDHMLKNYRRAREYLESIGQTQEDHSADLKADILKLSREYYRIGSHICDIPLYKFPVDNSFVKPTSSAQQSQTETPPTQPLATTAAGSSQTAASGADNRAISSTAANNNNTATGAYRNIAPANIGPSSSSPGNTAQSETALALTRALESDVYPNHHHDNNGTEDDEDSAVRQSLASYLASSSSSATQLGTTIHNSRKRINNVEAITDMIAVLKDGAEEDSGKRFKMMRDEVDIKFQELSLKRQVEMKRLELDEKEFEWKKAVTEKELLLKERVEQRGAVSDKFESKMRYLRDLKEMKAYSIVEIQSKAEECYEEYQKEIQKYIS